VAFAAPAAATQRSYEVDPARTRVEFTVDATGFAAATGTMKVRTGRLDLDTDHPENARVMLLLDAASIDTGFAARDEAIRGSSFLNVAAFPEIGFSTTAVYPDKDQRAMVLGELRLIGVSKPLTIETQLVQAPTADGVIEFTGRTRLSRSDWGMTAFLPLVGDEVQIRFQLTAALIP
jgi:polyisoprenoid-binding protein YceI